jgi:hypothetical protein
METIPSSSQMPSFGSNLPSLPIGQLSNFLRTALADEDSRQFSESLQQLALQAESVAAGLRLSRSREHAAPLLMDMLTVLRDHHGTLANLPVAWRGLYEYAAYAQALNNFRVLIGQWLLDVDPWGGELRITSEEFRLLAWRTLGEGTLLVDMYEQWLQGEERPGASDFASLEPQQWWQKLRR